MAFSTSYKTILDSNIRHIYSGLPSDIRFRTQGCPQSLDHAKRMHELYLKPVDPFQVRCLVSVPGYNTAIPKAPAFREASAEEVDEIVKRVSRPTYSAKMKREICNREVIRFKKEMCAWCELTRIPDTVPKSQLDNITRRLQTPTIATTIRNGMRDKRRFSLKSVLSPCEKSPKRPHYSRSGLRSAPH